MRGNLKAILADRLSLEERELLYRSYDVIGDTAIIRIPDALKHRSKVIAEAIMQTQRHVKTVLRQVTPVSGDLRLRKVEWIVGDKKAEALHKENGCLFKIALERCYFSPRLSHERMRISEQVKLGEVIVNMFSGVGCYSIVIAKHSTVEKVYSIDINPAAVRYMQENVKLNKVEGRVIPIEGDAKNIIQESLLNVADRILMPLPERAYEYLGFAAQALKQTGGWIHYYDFEYARKDESPVEKVRAKVGERLQNLGVYSEIPFGRIVRTTGPNWYQVAVDIQLTNLL
ncbi:MAG: class I SAM-dependent methyltransferase family protein [Candidatus Bathyarchaeota archaeon]|nr:MAG: class I SAM-dependent methyltransferase family protein [Candidatus Bathyarchaeota archaeon]